MSALGKLALHSGSCFTLPLLAGCAVAPAASDDGEGQARVKAQPVYGGIVSTEENDAVVQLLSGPDHNRICSGTVVAPRLVITARHCIAPYVEGSYQCSTDGSYSETWPRDPRDAGTVGQAYDPELVEIRIGQNPVGQDPALGEKIYTVQTNTICKNDIAIVRVDRDLPVAPRPMRLAEPTYPGEFVTVVGYGQTFTPTPGRHERHDVEIQAVGKSTLYPVGRGAYDRTFRLGQAACPGDSGGPTLSDKGAVLGVFSIIVNGCNTSGALNFYTQLAPYRDFIEGAFEDSGFEVIHEPGSSTDGGAGAASDSNGSGGSSSGGSDPSGGSAGEATTSSIISGRRKKKDGCSVAIAGDEVSGGHWGALLLGLGLLAFQRRSPAKRARH
ncbi:MAG TPA: trypsin-like serine protease [Polyangiaceae bacterium]